MKTILTRIGFRMEAGGWCLMRNENTLKTYHWKIEKYP